MLEAWAGVPAARALDAGRDLMAARPPARERAPARCRRRAAREGFAAEAVLRARRRGDRLLGGAAGARARRRRAAGGPARRAAADARPAVGPAQPLPRPPRTGWPSWAAPAAARAAAARPRRRAHRRARRGRAVAALLTLTWTAGTVLIARRWSALYAGGVIAATGAMLAGVAGARRCWRPPPRSPPWRSAPRCACRRPTSSTPPGRARRALAAMLIGAGLGAAAGGRPERRLDGGRRSGARPAPVDGRRVLGRLPPVEVPAGHPARAVRRAGGGRRRRATRRGRACACCSARWAGSSPPPWCSPGC